MNSKLIRLIVLAVFLGGSIARAGAQAASAGVPLMPPPAEGVSVQMGGEGPGFQFVSGEPGISTHVVKGAPYSLEATIESAQTLSDGNRIVHRQAVLLYRDSKGRTRREETLAAIGPWATSGTPTTMITIQDPVSGVSYFLDPQRKTATKLPSGPPGKNVTFMQDAGGGPATASESSGPMVGSFVVSAGEGHAAVSGFSTGSHAQVLHAEEKSEALGKENIAGLSADGTRTTTTIPANIIGNERPLDIVRQRWYSSELQIVLRSKQTDPRFGETTYEVTKLDREEPVSSLFEIPSDYTVRKGETHVFMKHDPDSK